MVPADRGRCRLRVSVIELATQNVARRLALPAGNGLLREVRISPDGRLAAVTHTLARFQMPTTSSTAAGSIRVP